MRSRRNRCAMTRRMVCSAGLTTSSRPIEDAGTLMSLDFRKATTIALALLLPIYASAADDVLQATARRLAEAYAIGDAAAFSGVRRARIEVEQMSRIDCSDLKGITIDSTTIDDATATIHATVVRAGAVKHLLMTLHHDGDHWSLTNLTSAERAMAAQLANDPAQWDALVRDQPELLNRDRAFTLADRGPLGGGPSAHPAAVRAATAALENLAALLGDPATRSLAATSEATIADVQSDPARTKERVAEAMKLARESKDPEVLTRAMVMESRIYERGVNGTAKALEVMREALPLIEHVENRLLAIYVVGNVGNLNLKSGNYADALMWFQRSAAMSKEIDDVTGIMRIESVEGVLLQMEGNYELAIQHILRATKLGENNPSTEAWSGQDFINLAICYQALGRAKEALDALHQAAGLRRRSKAPVVIGETHRVLGSVYRRQHDYPKATRELEEAISVFENAKRIHFIPGAMSELALTRLDAGDARDAVARAERCAEYSRNLEEPMVFIECRTFAGEAHRALGESDAALAAFRDAIDVSEEQRRALIGDARQRSRFLEHNVSPYLGAADILAERGDVAAALEMTERAKARTLLDVLGGDVSHKQNVLTPAEEQRDAELAARIAVLNRKLGDAKEKDAVSKELAAARADYESYQVVLDAAHPRRQALQGSVPIAKASDLTALLGSTTAVVEYVVSDDHTRAFVITDRGVTGIRITAGARELDPIVARFTDALAHDDLAYRKDAQALYVMLMQPIETALRGKKAICIVPDGSLWRLPFEALIDRRGKFVIESRTCFYAPSMSVLAQVAGPHSTPPPANALLAVGNPTVRGAEEEVRALRSLYGDAHSRVYAGKEAAKANVTRDMENARVLHFATHAILEEDNPMYSVVVLADSRNASDDGLLAAWEIMRLQLRADIAVLSACDTARGRFAPGEGVIGFTWSLFVAGCPSSVVSEWKVDSNLHSRS